LPNPELSPGIKVGDTLYVSGQIAADTSGNVVGECDCEAQSREVMDNIQAVVKAVEEA
jgi:enamine deaminase RidA (YjgF/YER057c/UK114 family)